MLRLREAVDLVEEQDGAAAVLAEALAGAFDDLAHIFHPCGDGAELFECTLGAAGHSERQGGLARTRRPPEDGAGEAILFHQAAQCLAGADEMLLAHHIVERARAKPCGQRCLLTQLFFRCRAEQIVHPFDAIASGQGNQVRWRRR